MSQQQPQQPYNPSNFTNQLGQKAAEFTAAQLERMGMGGTGFIGGAQNRLIGQQVGTYITNEVNELFHIQNPQGTGQAKPQSGVRNFISNEVGQIFHGKKDEVEGAPQNPQNTEGLMEGAADFVMYQAKQVFHSRGGKDGQPTEVQTVTQVTKTVTTDSGHPGSHMPTGYQQQVTQIEHHYEPTHEPVNNGGGPGSHIPSGAQTGPRDNYPQQNYGYQGQQPQNYGGGYQGQQQQSYGGGYQGQQQNYGGGYQGQQQQNYGGGYQGQQPYEGNQQRPGEDDEDGFFEKTTNKVKGYFNKD